MPFREWNLVFREWNFEFRELLREYPGTLPELQEWPFSLRERFFLKLGWFPGPRLPINSSNVQLQLQHPNSYKIIECTPRHKTNTCRKKSWGINFCANTCGACIRTRTNTGKYFWGIVFRILANLLMEFISVQIYVPACICTPANTGKYSWRIIYVLVSCQGVIQLRPEGQNARGETWLRGLEVLGPLRGLGIRPLVSAIRGLGIPLPGPPLRAPERLPEARRGFSGASERCVRFQRSGKTRWATQRPVRGPIFPDAPWGGSNPRAPTLRSQINNCYGLSSISGGPIWKSLFKIATSNYSTKMHYILSWERLRYALTMFGSDTIIIDCLFAVDLPYFPAVLFNMLRCRMMEAFFPRFVAGPPVNFR